MRCLACRRGKAPYKPCKTRDFGSVFTHAAHQHVIRENKLYLISCVQASKTFFSIHDQIIGSSIHQIY